MKFQDYLLEIVSTIKQEALSQLKKYSGRQYVTVDYSDDGLFFSITFSWYVAYLPGSSVTQPSFSVCNTESDINTADLWNFDVKDILEYVLKIDQSWKD